MSPDLLNIYVRQIKKLPHAKIAEKLRERGIVASREQVTRTLTGERENMHLRKPIEEIIEMPGAFDAEFEAVAALRRTA
jgi:hypothetical protein